MSTNPHGSQNLCAGPDIYVALQQRRALIFSSAERHLLEDETVHANDSIGVDYDSVGVGNEEPAANDAVERNIRTGDH